MILDTQNKEVFCVGFNANNNPIIVSSELGQLGDCIKEFNRYGILYIKRFYGHKQAFKRMSKQEVKSFFDHDTHSTQQLIKSGFIK